MSDTRLLRGIGVSPGVAVGRAVVLQFTLPELPGRVVARKDVPREVRRLRDGVRTVRRYLDRMRERAARRAGAEEAKIFDAQILMLEDADFLGGGGGVIRGKQRSAEGACELRAPAVRNERPGGARRPGQVADE